MAKFIVVCGATGQVGGSIARRMLKEGWRVRAITRNVNGAAAKALVERGAELTTADYDDESSLKKAFEGANVIFGLTQFWEYLMTLGQHGAGQKEYDQMLTIARVASQTSTLEHFILHTLASGEKLAGPDNVCPHWDYKDKAADEIKKSMPELAAKTTFLWIGWFVSNLWTLIAPMEIPGTYGGHIWMVATPPSTPMWITDIENNVGVFIKHILAKPEISAGKIVSVHTDVLPYGDALKAWSEVSGKRAEYIEITPQACEGIFGVFGKEIASQFQMNAVVPDGDWSKPYGDEVVTSKELGISASELLNLKQSLEANKEKL